MRVKTALTFLILFAATARAEEKEPPAPDRFLRDWVQGGATFEITPEYHRLFPRSPHKRDSEDFEVAVKCYFLREKIGEVKATALATELAAIPRDGKRPLETRRRAIHVLGRLRVPDHVPLLISFLDSEHGGLREAAIAALGFFGTCPAEDGFLVFGGRVRKVVFPAAPVPAATKALVARFRKFRDGKRRPRRRTGPGLLDTFLALESHASDELAALAIETLASGPAKVGGIASSFSVQDLLGASAEAAKLKRLAKLLQSERSVDRRLGAWALGWSARREAVPLLLAARKDEVEGVVKASAGALQRLAGVEKPAEDYEKLLGGKGERFDPEKAKRWPRSEPGIWRVGR
ncbi:MAG: HEAT repeat domain-containing protein [Planctomycetota bacterium]